MQTSGVAKLLDISPATVRNYGDRFSEYLSEGASPPKGESRSFTDRDVRILAAAWDLVSQGMTYEEAHRNLAAADLGNLPPLEEPEPIEEPEQPGTALAIAYRRQENELARVLQERDEAIEEVKSLTLELGRLQGRLETLETPWWKKLIGR
jgi:DNA-binding transcriptional MerR regulator